MADAALPRELMFSSHIRTALDAMAPVEIAENEDRPVFVLASGWRTGSTLVQRLVMSGDVFMWGEPFMETGWLHSLGMSIALLRNRDHKEAAIEALSLETPLHEQWVASLNPGVPQFLDAHKAMVQSLLRDPIRVLGYDRWGAKFVRLDGNYTLYLCRLFPAAKFVLLVRDPVEAFLSYRRIAKKYHDDPRTGGWELLPGWRINSPDRFFAMARHLIETFVEAERLFPERMRLVRYERIAGNVEEAERLGAWLDVPLDPGVLNTLASARNDVPAETPMTSFEQREIERWRGSFEKFGYG